MQKIYCISGLGADHRLFSQLAIPGYDLMPLPWAAFDKSDDMSSYASKMAAQISDSHAIIIGLSFGGMLATEIAKIKPSWKIFIVSSAKTSAELGYNSSFLRWVSRAEIVPSILMARSNPVTLSLLGAETKEEKKLIKDILNDADPAFYRWSLNTILHWNNTDYSPAIIHIHGTRDKVILSEKVHPDYWIEGGSHIMIYNRAAEVDKIISDSLLM